ncbi:MAG TPA: sugar phosphate isomerase/epimerase family protein [Planctomycetota bacterium]|nr:sugar phosphate isomerase/epimerase family protein [Planctomycetota bacterium]
MLHLAVNSLTPELEATVAFCRAQALGLELCHWAFPQALENDQPQDFERQAALVTGLPFLSVHGPFLDLIAASRDPGIVDVSRRRHQTALSAACRLGAKTYVAHTNYNPLIRNPPYRKAFLQRSLEFWLPLADVAGRAGVTIALENLWEAGPDLQAELIAQGKHPHLKALFDNGHALVFSKVPAVQWIETLGAGLAHCHLHDNHGEQDEHLPVGTPGCKEDWPAYVAAIRRFAPQATLVMESDRLEMNQKSLAAVQQTAAESR